MTLSFKVIEDEESFYKLKSDWQKLYLNCPDYSPFQSPSWHLSWWKNMAPKGQLFIVCAMDKDELVGLAPLFIQKQKFFGRTINLLKLIGTGPAELNNFIINPNWQKIEVIKSFFDLLFSHLNKDFDLILLEEIPEFSLIIKYISSQSPHNQTKITVSPSFICPLINLSENHFDDLCNSRHFKRNDNFLNKLGKMEYKFTKEPKVIQKKLPQILSLHQQEWKSRKDSSQFESGPHQSFIRDLLKDPWTFYRKHSIGRIYFKFCSKKHTLPFPNSFLSGYGDNFTRPHG